VKLAGYDFEGPFTGPSEVKDLPGVYVVLNFGVLDVGESGWQYHEGGQGMSNRLRTHERKHRWELAVGQGKGRACIWPETLVVCGQAFTKETLKDKCRRNGIYLRGDKKELCARLYEAGDREVVDLMEKHLQTMREELLKDHCIENIALAVHYEPDGYKRLNIEQDLKQRFNPLC
jgi:hypothetical protein